MEHAATSARLVLLLKSQKFANQPGYFLHGGRWHAIKQDKPVPNGAPQAAHPKAAGHFQPAIHFTPDEWKQLELPPENSNAASYNKKLAQIKELSDAGDVTGLLGMPLGVNTYNAKAATIINHLLALHGSPHKVAAGQKAGEHEAVNQKPLPTKEQADAELAQMVAGTKLPDPAAAETPAEPAPAAEPDPAVNEPAPTEPDTGKLSADQLGKLQSIPWFKQKLPDENSNAKTHNAAVAKIEAMAFAGDTAGLQAFIDKKAGAKQTYAKKQALLAQTALAALTEGGAPAAQAATAPAAPAANPAPAKKPKVIVKKPAAAKHEVKLPAWPSSTFFLDGDTWKKKADSDGKVFEVQAPLAIALYLHEGLPVPEDLSSQLNADVQTAVLEQAAKDFGKPRAELKALLGAAKPAPTAAAPAAKTPLTKKVQAQVFHNTTPGHNKFWSISVNGNQVKTQYGKIGSKGVSTVNAYGSPEAAQAAAQKIIATKKKGGYVDAGSMEHSWLAPDTGAAPAAAKKPTVAVDIGPKDGDTKQGADGMLVFKDGHWHKVDDGTGGWTFTAKNPGLSGEPSLEFEQDDMAYYLAGSPANGYEFAVQSIDSLGEEPPESFVGMSVAEAVQQAQAAGHPVPPVAALQKLDPSYKPAPGAKAAPKAKPTAAKQAPAAASTGAHPSIDHWVQTGPQGGSNPGGKFKDENGVEWYCKFPADEDTAKSEVLAAKLYAAAGIAGQDAKLVTKGGKLGIASRWVDVKKGANPTALSKAAGVKEGFAVDSWLGNWDVVGLGYDNLQIGADGKAVRVDAGGSLQYRAQGGKKAFGHTVTELDSLRDQAINPQSAAVFGKMTKADIAASVAKVLAVPDATIASLVAQFGPGDAANKQALVEALIARKADLAAKFPNAKKEKKKPVFDASKISAPPDFLNWGGSGQSGPSSKEFLNQANHRAAQYIYKAAQTGDVAAVKALQAPLYDKNSGAVTGKASVLDHPSQHIKGYAQQVINEIDFQMNPPKQFRFDGGHPLHSLNASYPPFVGALQSSAVHKAGKFVVLGDPGTLPLDAVGLPKITHKAGQLTQQTYSAKAQAAISKMPQTQRQAVKAYTGSGYHKINGSLWSGNPSGEAKAAAEALHTLAHDIAPGTVLSRKISIDGPDLNQILGATGKVLQEPAIMSTSIRPTSWGGNVQLKLHVGPGVKGLWVGPGSMPGGGAMSNHPGEDEMILPPNTRLLVLSVKKSSGPDADGFGQFVQHIVEAVILPSEGY